MTTNATDNEVHPLAYCTNVHSGRDWSQTYDNLKKHAPAVKSLHARQGPMGIGLWLSQNAARGLTEQGQVDELAAWFAEQDLIPFTFNGFPQGDFHQPVVKHRVYEPTWFDSARRDYTLELVGVMDRLLPTGVEGSISTLPIAWGSPPTDDEHRRRAVAHLRHVAAHLHRLEQSQGRLIHLCLEPEPGCLLQRSEDMVRFFEDDLLPGGDEDIIRRHLRICHDVCHAAVMFEPQNEALNRYRDAGLLVGKVQVSSAIAVRFDQLDRSQRVAAVEQLTAFAEDRYLHQTVVQSESGQEAFHEDLPGLLHSTAHPEDVTGQWRVHFHVPIYLESFGLLETTRSTISECLANQWLRGHCNHYEVETYAWGVLPPQLRTGPLAAGIARELDWLAHEIREA